MWVQSRGLVGVCCKRIDFVYFFCILEASLDDLRK
nr:MAG TPA: hypothetical protein [Caudoviricetes sp.]